MIGATLSAIAVSPHHPNGGRQAAALMNCDIEPKWVMTQLQRSPRVIPDNPDTTTRSEWHA